MQRRSRQLIRAWLLVGAAAVCLQGCGSSSGSGSGSPNASSATSTGAKAHAPGAGKPPVVLGTKNFTEEIVLGQLYAQALRAKGYKVTLRPNIGASEVMQGELAARAIDGYPEYTGTILSVLAHDPRRPPTAAVAYARAASYARQHNDVLLAMAAATDTDVLIAKPQFASAHHLRSLTDLRQVGSPLTVAAAPEFRTRFNGMVGLRQVYGVTTLRLLPVKIGDQYRALDDGRSQLAAVFTTDGQLTQGGYTLLTDPQNIFGFQNVTFVVRRDVLDREGPAFARTINSVSANLSTQALRVMNAAVVLDGQNPAAVAHQFLAANGLT
ncbi:MAG TPA: ABC transporter substrate-binding protein [Solirubrobacteraceae bacterium]|nr:ABC transporter substrate-binding protein [Solirubrobacteraceae bacterium]